MSPTDLIPPQYKALATCIAVVVAIAAVGSALAAIHHHIYQQGYQAADEEWTKREAAATVAAGNKLADANEKVRVAQAWVTEVMQRISDKQKEVNDAKAVSDSLRADLLASRKRLSVLVTAHKDSGAEHGENTAAAGVDQGAVFAADLSPEVAANLTELATEGDQAITRLNACIRAYEVAEKAANSVAK